MYHFYTEKQIQELKRLFVDRAKSIGKNGQKNIILLSGGVDSLTALFAFHEAQVPYEAICLYIDGYKSEDRNSVERLSDRFNIKTVPFAIDEQTIKESVKKCREYYDRIRRVKCETIYMFLKARDFIPTGSNVITGMGGGQICAWEESFARAIRILGEDDEAVLKDRVDDGADEAKKLFEEYGCSYFDIFGGDVAEYCCQFTTTACNKKKPKGIFVFPFFQYYREEKCYRKPKPFQKAGNFVMAFDDYAKAHGYKDALVMFKEVDKNG